MSASIFSDKAMMPDEAMLTIALGETKTYLDQICSFIETETGHLAREWKHYGQKSGWTLKLFSKKRNLLFVLPGDGVFTLAFVFGARAVDAILKSELPDTIKSELINAQKYAEGRGIRFLIKDKSEIENVLKLIRIKVQY